MKLQRKLQLREKAISKTTRHSPSISELAENMEENDRTDLSPISFQGGEALINFAQHHENRSRSGKQLFNRIGFMKNLGGIDDKSVIQTQSQAQGSQGQPQSHQDQEYLCPQDHIPDILLFPTPNRPSPNIKTI